MKLIEIKKIENETIIIIDWKLVVLAIIAMASYRFWS